MKILLHAKENGRDKYSCSSPLIAVLMLFFAFAPVFIFMGNAQVLTNYKDSISAYNRKFIPLDAREADDWNDMYAIAVTSSITASGQGVYFTPFFIVHSKIGFFALGPTIQKEKMNFSGFQLNYELNLLGKNSADSNYFKRLELYTFFNASYQYNAMLSQSSQKNELLAIQTNPNPTLLRVYENYAGVGLRIELFSNFKWFNCVGFGGYKIIDAPKNLIHDKKGMGLFLRTGISYEFDKNNRTPKGKTVSTF